MRLENYPPHAVFEELKQVSITNGNQNIQMKCHLHTSAYISTCSKLANSWSNQLDSTTCIYFNKCIWFLCIIPQMLHFQWRHGVCDIACAFCRRSLVPYHLNFGWIFTAGILFQLKPHDGIVHQLERKVARTRCSSSWVYIHKGYIQHLT